MSVDNSDLIRICHVTQDFAVSDLDDPSWRNAVPVGISKYWSGEPAPASRQTVARLLWSASSLYVKFEAAQHEPIVAATEFDISTKSIGLWDRDVCEIFISPDSRRPSHYFEFEAAPNAEWIDLEIEVSPEGRNTNWDFISGMQAAAEIRPASVLIAMKISWMCLGGAPQAGDRWRGNLFRCVGREPDRGYLAWRPTMTEQPNFHVPEKFGEMVFLEADRIAGPGSDKH